jgi:hypothetical protein
MLASANARTVTPPPKTVFLFVFIAALLTGSIATRAQAPRLAA